MCRNVRRREAGHQDKDRRAFAVSCPFVANLTLAGATPRTRQTARSPTIAANETLAGILASEFRNSSRLRFDPLGSLFGSPCRPTVRQPQLHQGRLCRPWFSGDEGIGRLDL